MKPGKVPCCNEFFVHFFDLDCAKNTLVAYSVLRSEQIDTCWLGNS